MRGDEGRSGEIRGDTKKGEKGGKGPKATTNNATSARRYRTRGGIMGGVAGSTIDI